MDPHCLILLEEQLLLKRLFVPPCCQVFQAALVLDDLFAIVSKLRLHCRGTQRYYFVKKVLPKMHGMLPFKIQNSPLVIPGISRFVENNQETDTSLKRLATME